MNNISELMHIYQQKGLSVISDDCGLAILLGTPIDEDFVLGCIKVNDAECAVDVCCKLIPQQICQFTDGETTIFFIKAPKLMKNIGYKRNHEEEKHLIELLSGNRQISIPPTTNKKTGQAYRWQSMPLHEFDLHTLPVNNFLKKGA